ncbi:MAG: ATP-binding protein [Rubritepida sp.]|jgi:signal transduction histidine kinase|nr:ATP-binding protein [Rubritepida sp.]MCU0944862.1 ATP-binding protein [Rubritepida sp.]
MGFDILHLLLLLAVLGLAAHALAVRARLAGLRADVATARRVAEQRGRALGLLARDVNAAGLGLLGRAQVLGGEAGAAFEAEARHVLTLGDAAAEAGGGSDSPRILREERVPLGPLMQEAIAAAAAQLGPGVRHWRVRPGLEDLTVRADRRALRGALVQVLTRAARATGEGDFIDIHAAASPQAVSIVVEDEGVGVAVEDLAPASHDGGAERSRGLGLGLALARALLRAHGGELVVEAAPGVGARTFLSLPAERVVAA